MNRFILGLFLLVFCACTHQEIVNLTPPEGNDVETADYVSKNTLRRIAKDPPQYKIVGDCGGFPQINVKTAPGFCVGLLDNGEGTVMPRTAVEIAPGKILMTDMGGWDPSNGKLYLLTLTNGKYIRTTVLNANGSNDANIKAMLDRVHMITKGPDGLIYMASVTRLVRFNPLQPDWVKRIEILISNFPDVSGGLHPLKTFTFDNDKNIYINIGSATNVCKKEGIQFTKNSICPNAEKTESGQGQIWKYTRTSDGNYSPKYEVYAKGLRNSMGLWWHKEKNILLQVENGRDSINEINPDLSNRNLPHEELNVIKAGQHYGWPYCYDNNLSNPEWAHLNCSKFAAPYLLLPAHSSPLSLNIYDGPMFPAWYKNRVIIGLHGYEPLGHRIVAYLRDDNGLPAKRPLSIVYGWNADGTQALGSPVSISQMADGSLLIVEDKSRKVLRLFYNASLGNGAPVDEIPDIVLEDKTADAKLIQLKEKLAKTLSSSNPPTFAQIQNKMIDTNCVGCHAGADARGLELAPYDYENNELRILEHKKARQILGHLQGNMGLIMMPPDGFKNDTEKKAMIDLYTKWLTEKGL